MTLSGLILFLLAASAAAALSVPRYDAVVARDGSGTVRTVQAALDLAPSKGTEPFIIFVKKGVYNEKLFVTKSNVALVGEHPDSTVIVFAELRRDWNASMKGNDWGTAVVNIDSSVTDLTMMRMTVYNNYGAFSGVRDHQFAVWGKGTRIILQECRIVSDGGDALSLWNERNGMYYHAECRFEGWVDFVCPRGWCYITRSRFFGHNRTASLWHDGSADPDQKFVIVDSRFDGVPGFPLGRHHRDGQFIFVNAHFSSAMADSAIAYPSYSPNARPWTWGRRHYFHDCHRDGGDFAWFADNFDRYPGGLAPAAVTPQWTFGGRWDPERTLRIINERIR